MCDHKYVYGGVKYKAEKQAMSGTSASRRFYYDWFYCEKCLDKKYEQLNYWDTTYNPIRFDALPMMNEG